MNTSTDTTSGTPNPTGTGAPGPTVESLTRPTRVFVYGSLLSGLHNHGMIARARRHGVRAVTHGSLAMVELAPHVPALVRVRGHFAIVGEVYDVRPALLELLDRFEGVHAGLYRREVVPVSVEHADGTHERTTAEAYVSGQTWRASRCRRVPGGHWREHLARRAGEARSPA